MQQTVQDRSTRVNSITYLDRVVRRVETVLSLLGGGIVMLMMFYAFAQVVGRFVFNSPLVGHIELMEILMVVVVFLGISNTQATGGHIGVDFVLERIKGRPGKIINSTIYLITAALIAVLLKYSVDYALLSIQMGDKTAFVQAPYWPAKLLITFGLSLLLIRLILQFIKSLSPAPAKKGSG